MDGLGERLTKSKGLFILKGDTANLFITWDIFGSTSLGFGSVFFGFFFRCRDTRSRSCNYIIAIPRLCESESC